MTQDVLLWCLVAIAVIAIAAVVALMLRSRALGRRKTESEAALEARLRYAQGELDRAQAALVQLRDEQDGVIREAGQAAEENTKAVLKGAARFLQSLAAEQTTLLDGVQREYGGHAVLSDLMDITHANAQMARKAQGIAVMCGAPLGRRNQPASVYDVVRSAQSQIRNFQRVEIMQPSGIALKASAVAPVALAVAELLDNAASFSHEDRQRASAQLSGEGLPRLSQLGTQPKFGFPVIGLIARQHGFTVDVTGVSRYGGVRAVVLLPEELWTMEEALPPATEAPVSSIRPMETGRSARTAGGLPKRGSRISPAGVPAGGETPRRSARRGSGSLAALQRGTQSARDTASFDTFDTQTPGGSENA
jgi:Tfp pilus assembly protein FimT